MGIDSLFVSGEELDQELLTQILAPFLKISKETGAIIPNERWLKLNSELKIILLLLARKATKLRNPSMDGEGLTPNEITLQTGMKGNSVRPTLKSLLEDRLVNKGEGATYSVPNYALVKIKAMLENHEK